MTTKRQIDRFIRTLEEDIGQTLNARLLRDIGNIASDLIKSRTRRGFGVQRAGGQRSPLRRLSPAYIAFRESAKRLNTSVTSPGKSNLSFTGALLNSIKVVKINESSKEVFINANKRRRKGGATNEEVAEFVTAQGRAFLNLSRREIGIVSRRFNNSFRQQFKSQRR